MRECKKPKEGVSVWNECDACRNVIQNVGMHDCIRFDTADCGNQIAGSARINNSPWLPARAAAAGCGRATAYGDLADEPDTSSRMDLLDCFPNTGLGDGLAPALLGGCLEDMIAKCPGANSSWGASQLRK